LFIVGGYFALFLLSYFEGDSQTVLCPTRLISGVPCPGCGMGRASVEIFHGNFIDSIYFHVLAIPFNIIVIISLIWMISDLVKRKESFFPAINRRMRTWQWIILVIIIAAAWVINIVRDI
jgi:hypothetical protein